MDKTESVKNYIEGRDSGVDDYFIECNKEGKLPNYSEFCRKYLSGTTSEGVSFSSIGIVRKDLTKILRNKYKLWVGLR